MADSGERLATLEAQHRTTEDQLGDIKVMVGKVHDKVDAIETRLAKQSGFVAGVLAVVLPLWSAVTLAAGALWDYVSKNGSSS